MKKPFLAAIFGAAALLALLYSLPQLRHGKDAVALFPDETYYTARLERALRGEALGNPWTYENRDDPTPVPALPEKTLAGASRLFPSSGQNAERVMVAARAILPVLAFLIFHALLSRLGLGQASALLLAFWVLAEPGIISYKPFGGFWGMKLLPFSRFSNPSFPLVTFFGTLLLATRAFFGEKSEDRKTIPWAIATGIGVGLHFYISIYYWTHLVVGLVLAVVLSRHPKKWAILGAGAGAATLVAAPYFVSVAQLRTFPGYETFAWRNGILLKDRALYLLPHKTLWLFIAATIPLWKRPDEKLRFLLAFVAAGLACYFSSLVTGVSLQNFHWHYTLAPLLFFAAALTLLRWSQPRFPASLRPAVAPALFLLATASCLVGLQRSRQQPENALWAKVTATERQYHAAWDWLKAHAEPGSVVLANDLVSDFIPMRTGLHAFVTPHLIMEILPYERILERYRFLWALEGQTPATLQKTLLPTAPAPIAQWGYGMDSETIASFRERRFPALDLLVSQEVARRVATGFHERAALANARALRIDWLVRGPAEEGFGPRPDKLFRLQPMANVGGVRIDRVLGWK